MGSKVIVIGGGIGGLALAQGLRPGGVEVAVYERDRSPADRLQGYRVHINEAGSRALHACLPPALFDAFLATCGQPNTGIGGIGIQGKVWLTEDVTAALPERLSRGPLMIPGPRGLSMFLALHQFQPIPAELTALVGPEAAAQRDYVMWGLLTRRALLPANLEEFDEAGLRSLALARIQAWHPTLRSLVAASDLQAVLLTPIRTSIPVDPWPATNVTLLGDAIHSMPPTGGIGANTALRDAALLAGRLTAVATDAQPLLQAITAYETEMRSYGFDAVRSSLRNLRQQQRTESSLALAGMKLALLTMNAIPPLKRRALR